MAETKILSLSPVYGCHVSPALFVKKSILLHCIAFASLSKISWALLRESVSGFSILFHSSVCVFLRQHLTVLMTLAMKKVLKSSRVILPTLYFFFSKTVFAVLAP